MAARVATTSLLVLSCAAFLGLGVLPHLGLYRSVTVLSQSMRPTFAAGDVIVVTPERLRDVRPGQVITYQVPIANRYVESHRVVSVRHRDGAVLVQTKGDANAAADPWTAGLRGPTAWRLRFRIPYAGRPLVLLRSPLFHLLALALAPLALAVLGLARIWRLKPRVHDALA